MKYWFSLGILFLILFSLSAFAEESYKSKYVGQEHRKIKSLSPDDIKELKRGGGWGLAKAAELNGVPGPAHILEMAEKINLTDEQKREIQKIHNDMKVEAVALGEQLIRLEVELNIGFSNRTMELPQNCGHTEQPSCIRLQEVCHNGKTIRQRI